MGRELLKGQKLYYQQAIKRHVPTKNKTNEREYTNSDCKGL